MAQPHILFLSHGGGPMPLLGDAGHQEMVSCLQSIAQSIPEPSAILVISAHWEATVPTVTAAVQPELIYDYYGFPEESYSIQYPCPGHPELAGLVFESLHQAGLDAAQDSQRGLDHGVFVPLKIMYPKADIPCVQLSLLGNLDPAQHIKLGQALQSLTETFDGTLLVIGSGFSFHNMKAFFTPDSAETRQMNQVFDAWLRETCSSQSLSEDERAQRLIDWAQAPSARYCHPREEHLLPLQVCYGLAGRACKQTFELSILNKKSSMMLW